MRKENIRNNIFSLLLILVDQFVHPINGLDILYILRTPVIHPWNVMLLVLISWKHTPVVRINVFPRTQIYFFLKIHCINYIRITFVSNRNDNLSVPPCRKVSSGIFNENFESFSTRTTNGSDISAMNLQRRIIVNINNACFWDRSGINDYSF